MDIRFEKEDEYNKIKALNDLAFGSKTEGLIVDKVRKSCEYVVSLVAVKGDDLVGHIFFSPVEIKSGDGVIEGMGLAPMAVHPSFQNKNIGSKLVSKGIDILKKQGCPFIIVLGHEKYYPRFGFEKASTYGIESQWKDVPDDAFMILVIDGAVKEKLSGVAYYRSEFDVAV